VATKVATAAGVQSYQAFVVGSATSGQTCAGILTITGADTTSPATWAQASTTSTNNQPPDPPALTGLNGDPLVMAIGAWSVTTAGTTAGTVMANYTAQINGPTGTHLTHLMVSTRALTNLNNATEDPVAYTDNVTPNGTVAMTIAVPMFIVPSAINTRDRRASVIGLDTIPRIVLPSLDAKVGGWDRCQLTGKYIGLASDYTTPPVSTLQFRNRTDSRHRFSPAFPC
jgi:hypothetical protein